MTKIKYDVKGLNPAVFVKNFWRIIKKFRGAMSDSEYSKFALLLSKVEFDFSIEDKGNTIVVVFADSNSAVERVVKEIDAVFERV